MPHDRRSASVPGLPALEAKLAEARPTLEDFFGTEHARLFGALCSITGDRDEVEAVLVGMLREPTPEEQVTGHWAQREPTTHGEPAV